MRLTLRTMLAYLDEQLDPPQMEEIGQKIRESGVATAMTERVRAAMRKHRMEAPKLDGRGIGKDANSVAEYLDNVLDKDEIAELEQLCLNSDMHLSEVAACHQILAVLPQVELEVDSRLRDRIYDIPSELRDREAAEEESSAVVQAKLSEVKAPGETKKKRKKKKAPRVPEYFKTPPSDSRKWLPLLLTAVLLLVGLGIGLFVTREQWMKQFAWQTPPASPVGERPAAEESPPSEEATPREAGEETGGNDAPATGTDAETGAATPPPPAESEGAAPAEGATESADDAQPTPTEGTDAAPPEPGVIAEAPPPPDGEPAAPRGSSSPPTAVGGAPAVAWDSTSKGWRRATLGEILPADGVVQLIGSRLDCKLVSGVQATIVGPSEVRFEQNPEGPDAIWVMESGRILLDAKEAGGARFRGLLAGREVALKFVSPDAQVALEAIRQVPAGADPANPEDFPAVLFVDVLRGAVEVACGDKEELVEAGVDGAVVEIAVDGVIKPLAMRGAPLWVDSQTAGETAKQAGKELAARLADPQTPLSVALQEMATDRRVNVAALGAQALAQLGQIKPLCDQFRDVQYKLYWRQNHAFLRQLMQSSPASADMVRGQLDEHFPAESGAAYRILLGYTAEQFAAEGRQLLTGLESESLLLRVLAYQTLVDLTGPRGGKYQPDDPPQVRLKHLSTWIEAFEGGKLKVRDEE